MHSLENYKPKIVSLCAITFLYMPPPWKVKDLDLTNKLTQDKIFRCIEEAFPAIAVYLFQNLNVRKNADKNGNWLKTQLKI
jgi:hypothetical protein